jgi:hypothetical protein
MVQTRAALNPSETSLKPTASTLACALALILFATLSASANKQLFSLSIAAPSEPLKAGADLRLRVTITNTSDREIGFIRSPGQIPEEGFRYEVEVHDAQGQSAPPSAYVQDLKKSPTITEEVSRYAAWLKPGESFVDDLEITKFYDLHRPGKYTISVSREIPPRQNLGEGKVRSNSITVTVVP